MFSHLQHVTQHEQKTGENLLAMVRHGIEKEGLRVTPTGEISQVDHPFALGATLTHPYITTDYSEALLEFITPVFLNITDTLSFLEELHVFTTRHMGNESVWCASMPCHLKGDSSIPIAKYGTSNIGLMKQVYREGLAYRYGKPMQTIAGIHYNFSLPSIFWNITGEAPPTRSQVSEGYFGLSRNFNRHSWLLMYLFGASPAMDRSFFPKNRHALETLNHDTLYLPWATSLRMSDIGYNNQVQSVLNICYNNLDEYVRSLEKAIHTPHPPYEKIGLKRDDHYIQLNTNILQIENEYYSSIRPKRVAQKGEKPLRALKNKGVEYIEARCLDIDPLKPLGIDESTSFFMDVFLVFCAMSDSPIVPDPECKTLKSNFDKTVRQGRKPDLTLDIYNDGHIRSIPLKKQAEFLLESMYPVAIAMDKAYTQTPHVTSLECQMAKVRNPDLTPSSQLMAMIEKHGSFMETMLLLSKQHHDRFLNHPLSPERESYFLQLGKQSIKDREKIEMEDTLSFDDFLKAYFST